MRPHFNSHPCNPNNQLQLNGANTSAPQQQGIANQGNLGQIRPQFPVGMLNNPLAMPPFTNPNAYFPPNQFFPFPQGTFPNLPLNNLPQLFPNNAVNPSQFMPNGQLNMQNLVQNVAQLLQMQMMNCGPQNLGQFMNLPSGGGINNGMVPQSINGNVMQHMNHNAAADNGSHNAQQNDNLLSPGASTLQNNPGVANGVNNRNSNWRKPHNNNFTGNNRYDASHRGFGNKQFHHQQNAQGNFKFNNENQGKGNKNIGMKNLNASNHSEEIQVGQKRSVVPNYTEKEIQQWREQRKKNFPSKANMEKKLKENAKVAETMDAVSKIRRQQLKEILAKQAELGVEVAEIPSLYLSDSEQRTDGRQLNNNKPFGKRERFRKGKFHRNDRFSKRQRYENSYPANPQNQGDHFTKNQRATNMHSETKKEPSLLKKLLSSEIKKDKKHLLQVFRFMVMNSFFESSPERPLKYPVVIVKESGDESKIVDDIPELMEGDTCASTGLEDIVCTQHVDISSREYADDGGDDEVEIPYEDGEIIE
ncbi:hypothetical protein ACS0TY_003060 [Phlomoides rotata]